MKKRIYEIIEVSKEDDKASHVYDLVMMFIIFISIIPLAFKNESHLFNMIDSISVFIFIIDYFLRWLTANLKYHNNDIISYLKYPFSFIAIIDLLSILPSISLLNKGFKALKTIRLIRTFRVLRIFKSFRYSKNIQIIIQVGKNSKDALITVLYLAIGYIIVYALVIFNVEPDSFHTFFDAMRHLSSNNIRQNDYHGFFFHGHCYRSITCWYYYCRLYERNRISIILILSIHHGQLRYFA